MFRGVQLPLSAITVVLVLLLDPHGASVRADCTASVDLVRTFSVPGSPRTVRQVGDYNGDSYPDIVAGASNHAYVYWGGPDSLSAPPFELLPGESTILFGASVCGVDLDRDGDSEIVIGDSEQGNPNGPGKAFIFFGGSPPNPNPDLRLTPDPNQWLFGWFASPAGDVNNDNYEDVVISSIESPSDGTGHVYIYFGGSAPNATADWILSGPGQFGNQVCGAGDMNGDGYDDILVGARHWWHTGPESGIALVYYGGENPDSNWDLTFGDSTPYDNFGWSVSPAGHFNDDAYADVLVGTTHADGPGYANMYFGGSDAQLDLHFEGEEGVNNVFGEAVGTAGKLNADEFDDIIITDWTVNNNAGAVYIFLGGPTADTEPDLVINGTVPGGGLGYWTVGSVADFTGNGVREILATAFFAGQFYLYELSQPATITWTGLGDATSWDNSANWDLGRVPNSDDEVVIPNVGSTTEVVYSSGVTCIRSLTCHENLRLIGGELGISLPSTVQGAFTLTAPAILTGSGDVTVSGLLTWTGGEMSGQSSIVADGGLAISGTSPKELREGRRLRNRGTATWSGTGSIRHGEGELGTQIENYVGATFDITDNATMEHISGAGDPALFNNLGTLTKRLPGSGLTTIGADLVSAGTLDVQSGTLKLTGDFANFSNQTLLGGTLIVSGTLQFMNADIVTNAASIHVLEPTGAIVDQVGSSALTDFAANIGSFTTDGIDLATGPFTNSGSITIGPSTTWTVGGLYRQTSGRTTVEESTSLLTAADVSLVAGDVRGNGEVGGPGAVFTNSGTLLPGESAGTLDISGSYLQSPDGVYVCEIGGDQPGIDGYDQVVVSGTATLGGLLDLRLINNYVPEVGQEFLVLTAAAVVDSFEVIEVFGLKVRQENSNGVCRIIVVESNISHFVGPDGGSWFVASNWSPPALPGANSDILVGQEIRIGLPGALADEIRVLSPGTPAKSTSAPDVWERLVIGTGRLRLNGGSLTVRDLQVQPEAELSLESQSSVLRAGTLTISPGADLVWWRGAIEIDGGTFADGNPARFVGTASGQSRLVLLNGATGTAAGTTTLASGSGSHVELTVRGSGSRFATGELVIGLAGQAAVRVEDQSVISTGLGGAAPLMTIGPAGTLTGHGSVESNVTSNGVVAPGIGGVAGSLMIDGSYAQSVQGSLEIELGGTGEGQFDVLSASGNVDLSGRMQVSTIGGFQLSEGQTFRVMTFADRQGEFDLIEGAPVNAEYSDTDVTLVVTESAGSGEGSDAPPLSYDIAQNNPNPFNPVTSIRYEIPRASRVTVLITAVEGRTVRHLVNDVPHAAGRYAVVWDGRDDHGHPVASGTYFYSLRTPDFEKTRRLVLIK